MGSARQSLAVIRKEGASGLMQRLRGPVANAAAAAPRSISGLPYEYAEPPRPSDLDTRIAALARSPRFSIAVSAIDRSADDLQASVDSIAAQWLAPAEVLIGTNDASGHQAEEICRGG